MTRHQPEVPQGSRWVLGIEPHIGDAPTVARQVLEAVKSIEMVDDDAGDHSWLGESQVDGDAAAALLVEGKPAPTMQPQSGQK